MKQEVWEQITREDVDPCLACEDDCQGCPYNEDKDEKQKICR